uniref:FH2 domain-containing protein n=1 Tax=Leptobrachium leishanense TaxID=445787 RepID=A0A8C5QHK0_9ANUR
MLINMSMGMKDANLHSASSIHINGSPSAEIPLPPPPPPPNLKCTESPGSPFPKFEPKRRSRLRNFNWEAIPLEKVMGRPSLWSSESFQGELQIDTTRMEELFGKQEEDIQRRSPRTRRSMSVGDGQMTKVFLLDSRRSMNIGIFLKQFKRSAAEIVEDIRRGNGDAYSTERLSELLKHLPEREEVNRLKSFQGDRERLNEADLFVLLLLELPSSTLRLEALIFKKDFHAVVLSLLSTARELKGAAEELVQCTELHYILRLILKAGNFMNAGGYAGNAAGFRVSSLLKLADTKANKPGMNLLHFVVMEVQKKDARFLSFADHLKHVSISSRLSEDGLLQEFCKLQSRVTTMRQTLRNPEQQEIREQMDEFLEYAEDKLREVQREIEALQNSRQLLVDFLCEDEETFHLEECCKVFSCFCQRFQLAIKENKIRELEEQRQQQWEKKRLEKRHSMATCSSLDGFQEQDELELTLVRNLRNARRTSSFRLCRMRSLGSNWPSPVMTHKSHSGKIQDFCDQQNAHQMREVSERVLRKQMGHSAYNDFCKSSIVTVQTMAARNLKTANQSPVQNDPLVLDQVPKQNESEISRQLPVFKVTYNQCGPLSLEHEKDQSGADAFIHAPNKSGDEAPRQTHTLSQCPHDESKAIALSILTTQDGPQLLSQLSEIAKLEALGQPSTISDAAVSHGLLHQPGKYINEKLLVQTTANNSQNSVSHPETGNIQQTQSVNVSPKQLVSHSSTETQRQFITHCLSKKTNHSATQPGSKPPFQSLDSERACLQLSQKETEAKRQSIVQDTQESPRNARGAAQPPENSHSHSQSELGTSTKSKVQLGQENRKHLRFQSQLKIYRHSSTRSGDLTPDLSINKSGQETLIPTSQSGEEAIKATLAKPGLEKVVNLQGKSELTKHPTSQSWIKTTEDTSTCSTGYTQTESKKAIVIPVVTHCRDKTVKTPIVQPLHMTTMQPVIQSVSEDAKHTLCQFRVEEAPTPTSSLSIGCLSNNETSQSLTQDKKDASVYSSDRPELETDRQSFQQSGPETFTHSVSETSENGTLQQSEPVSFIHSIPLAKNIAASESINQDKQEKHKPLIEQVRSDTLKTSLSQTVQKPSKQALSQSVVKLSRQSIPKPIPKTQRQSIDQVGSETSNVSTPETSKHSLGKPGFSSNRTKPNDPVSVKHLIKAKEINVPMPTAQDKSEESQRGSEKSLKVEEAAEYKSSTKGVKDAQSPVQRGSPNPCTKWKKELQSTYEKEDGGKQDLRVESSSQEADWDNSGPSDGDNLKNSSAGRTGNNVAKKSRSSDFGFGVKRAHLNKDVPSACIPNVAKHRLPTSKQTHKEIRGSKLPHKLPLHIGVAMKPCPGKITGNTRVKKETLYPNVIEYSKVSERKSSLSLNAKSCVAPTQKSVDGSWNSIEPTREYAWTAQVTSNNSNSMTRLAIHAIKSCDSNSSIPRGARNSSLDPHKIWR